MAERAKLRIRGIYSTALIGIFLERGFTIGSPYALGFAAGAMIFVVIEEIVPESQRAGNKDIAAVGVMIGFVIMMILDVAFGQT